MITPRFHCRVEKDKLVFDRPEVFKAYIQNLSHKGDLELIIRPWQKEKSLQQLRYIHGVVFAIISDASGYTPEEVKGLLKGYFLTKYVKAPDGKEVPYVKSLADLTLDEMKQFIDDCIIMAAKHWGCVVPSPEEIT